MMYEVERRKKRREENKRERTCLYMDFFVCSHYVRSYECRGLKGEREGMKRTAGGMWGWVGRGREADVLISESASIH